MTARCRLTTTLALLAAAASAALVSADTRPMKKFEYPKTRVTETRDTLFGAAVADPYRWLEDEKASEVKEWMNVQDRYARDYLAKLPGREALAKRFRELYYLDTISAPRHRKGRYFYTRRHADKEKAIVYWKQGMDGKEQVLLDPNKMSKDGSTSLGVWVPTRDGKRVAFALRENNADEATMYVMDVDSGKRSEIDVIEGAKYASADWTPEGDGFYYTFLPTDKSIPVSERPGYAEVRFHKLGTDPKKDPLIHKRTGSAKTFISPDLSRDGRWLFVYIRHGWNSADVYYRDLKSKDEEWKPFAVGVPALFEVTAWKDNFYIFTNDGAPRWRVFKTSTERPERKHWKEIVPEPKDTVLDSVQIVGDHLVLGFMKSASNQLEVRTLNGKMVRNVPLPGIGSASGMVGEPDEDDAYFAFSSFTTPQEIYRTSVGSGKTEQWAKVKVPIDPEPYTIEQVWYPSRDGTKVSMFIVRRKDMPRNGSTPFLLTGYGGFNLSETPSFSAGLFAWLEAGGGYALPNLRGGGEYGEDWHKAGMLLKKQNVFDDFVGAAEYLVKEGYTKPERLAIRGGSNGGLLVGAAMTQRPDLFRAVVCAVPLLDMVRYHLFGSGRTWVPEYGSAEDEAQFKALFAYSPYHRVKKGERYPATLVMSADSDDRVDPMHARKFAALLQDANTGPHPILLRIEKNAGHGGADLIRQAVESSADSYAFLMSELGMKPAAGSGKSSAKTKRSEE